MVSSPICPSSMDKPHPHPVLFPAHMCLPGPGTVLGPSVVTPVTSLLLPLPPECSQDLRWDCNPGTNCHDVPALPRRKQLNWAKEPIIKNVYQSQVLRKLLAKPVNLKGRPWSARSVQFMDVVCEPLDWHGCVHTCVSCVTGRA